MSTSFAECPHVTSRRNFGGRKNLRANRLHSIRRDEFSSRLLQNVGADSTVTDETRAHFVVQKFVDHLPYYRQAQMLGRSGIELADATIGRYGIEAADLLTPIVWAMIGELIAADYLQVDETPLKVLKSERSEPGAQTAYLWTYGIPWSTVVFEYQPSRAGEHPRTSDRERRLFLDPDVSAETSRLL